jgi:uncharacterized protein (DUF305 family)
MRVPLTVLLLAAAFLTACASQPAPATATGPAAAPYAAGDVAFLQAMIGHHAQALDMTALVAGRSERPVIARLAERIRASQVAEIAQMRRWLAARHESDSPPEHHTHMPGMLTTDEMRRLEQAQGHAFDRLFLELMTRHHEGALTMVAELLATESAGLEPEVFRLASEVDADQRAEIARMQQILSTLDQGPP